MDFNKKTSPAIRVLNLLEVVASSPTSMTATEINQVLKLPKPTIHRLCLMLEEEGFLQPRLDGPGYVPGDRLSSLAIGVFKNNDYWRTCRHAILQRLCKEVGETCNISIPDGSQMVYFDRVETHWPLRIQFDKNQRGPVYCTASGKLFLNSMPSAKRRRLISSLKFEKLTPNTITNSDVLNQELKRIKKEDIGVDNEEFMQGMVSVSVPLKDSQGQFVGALAMHAPTARMNIADALKQLPKLRQAADELIELMNE